MRVLEADLLVPTAAVMVVAMATVRSEGRLLGGWWVGRC